MGRGGNTAPHENTGLGRVLRYTPQGEALDEEPHDALVVHGADLVPGRWPGAGDTVGQHLIGSKVLAG